MSIKHLLSNGKKEYMHVSVDTIAFDNAPNSQVIENSERDIYLTTVTIGANSANTTLTAYRIGDLISLTITGFNLTTAIAPNAIITQQLDAIYRPLATVEFVVPIITNSVLPNATVQVDTAGQILFFHDSVHTAFVAGQPFGTATSSSINILYSVA